MKRVLAVVVVLAFAVGSAAMVAPLFFLRPEARRPQAAPAPAPARVRIPAVGLDAPIEPETASRTGALTLTGDVARVGWYAQGVRPGQPGDAVIAGSDLAALASLDQVSVGSPVEVDMMDGTTLTFDVTSARAYAGGGQPDDLFARAGKPRLSLVATGTSRFIVEATLRPPR
jgi:hypothetical protein